MERKHPFFPPLHSWYITGLASAIHHGRANGVPPRKGAWEVESIVAGEGEPWPEEMDSAKPGQ